MEDNALLKKLDWISTSRLAMLSALTLGIYRSHYVKRQSWILYGDNRMQRKFFNALIHTIGVLAYARAFFLLYYTGLVVYLFLIISESVYGLNAFNQMAGTIYSINTIHLFFIAIESIWLLALTSWVLMVVTILNTNGSGRRNKNNGFSVLSAVSSNIFYFNYRIRHINSCPRPVASGEVKQLPNIGRALKFCLPLLTVIVIGLIVAHQTRRQDNLQINYDSDRATSENVANLINNLKKRHNESAREIAAAVLAGRHSNDKEVIAALLAALKTDPSDKVRETVAAWLSRIAKENEDVMQALIGAIDHDPSERVRWIALLKLVRQKPPMRRLEKVLLNAMEDQQYAGVRELAASSFSEINPISKESIQTLIRLSESDDWKVRQSAVGALGRSGVASNEIYQTITWKLTNDESCFVRGTAAKALYRFGAGAKIAVPTLMGAIEKDGEAVFQRQAVAVIGDYKDQASQAVHMLIRLLKNSADPDIRAETCIALAKIGREARIAIPLIIERLKNDKKIVRKKAALALGAIGGDPEARLAALVDCLKKDASSFVRRNAARALGRIGPEAKTALPVLHLAMQRDRANQSEIRKAIHRIEGE
jgi:HEAT repeat protein